MAVIGTVEVDVIPSTKQFVNKLRGGIMPQADQVGRQWGERFGAAAGDDARKRIELALGRLKDVNVGVDTKGAETKVAALRTQIDSLDKSNTKVAASSRRAGSGVGLLVASAAALGPALIPIGAVGIGAFAGMAGAASTAALAFAGARREIANNTTVGKQFQAGVDTLTGHLHALEATAAAGVLSGFTDAVKALAPLMPAVGRDVAYMSTQLGQIMRSVLPGVVSLFHQANPLFETFGDEAVKGAQAFNRWATSSTSVSTLVGYIETQLPVVEHTLAQVAEAAGRIITALAPLGSASLSSIGLLARVINEIPMSTLQILAPTVVAAVVAFKGFDSAGRAASSLSSFASSLSAAGGASGKLGGLLGAASTGLRGMGIAGLVAVPIIGGLVSILGRQQAAQAAARAQVDSYTQALLASNGAIDANVKQMIAKNLSDKGAFDAASRLGISQKTLTDALLGSTSALAQVNAATSKAADGIAKYGNNYHSLPKDAQDTRDAIDKVTGSLVTQSGELTGAAKRQRDIALATGQASAAARQQDATASALAARLGTNATAYLAAGAAATNQAAAEAKATLQMQLENDAAGLLSQALDKLNGKSLSIADAQNSFLDSLQSVREAAKQNGASLDNLTTKGRANQETFLGAIHNAQNYAEAQARAGKSSRQAAADYEQHIAALRKTAIESGLTRAQIDALIRKEGQVPKFVVTEAEARTARAEANIEHLKQNLHAIGSKTVYVSADTSGAIASIQQLVNTPATKYVRVITLSGPAPSGGKAGLATGGPVRGPGSGTSDSIPIWASNGEYMINAKQASRHRALLDAINYGAPGFASGGSVLTAAQRRAVARQSNARTSLQFTVDNQDLPRFAASVTQTANTIRTALQKLISDVRTGAQRGLGSSVLIGTLQRENTRLQHLANERVALSTKLKAADQRLVDARKAFQDEATTVANATRSGFSFTGTQFADSADLIGSLSSSVNQAGTFNRDLAALRKRHAAKSIVQQLAEAGAGSAGTTAHTLATASASDLRRINGLNSQLGVFSNAIGQGEARQLFGAGVDSAKGYVNGIESQITRVKSAASKLAKAVAKQIRADLGIHSPSRVTHELGVFVGRGMHEGMTSQVSKVRAAAGAVAAAATPAMSGGAGAGGVMQIQVAGVLKDERGDVVATLTQVGQQLTYGRNI